ncbi:MAG TPA: haloacid dehalogenase type II [Planctomycetota bacterium]|nr:haloacid dehalogenase type II [Planctomycetota bacterium]
MTSFEVLTFDCYGTLIDWFGGVRAAVRDTRGLAGVDVEQFVRDRDAADRELIAGAYRPYSEVLAESARKAARAQSRTITDGEAEAFAASIRSWQPFAESHGALHRLASKFRLAILSNVDTASLEASVAQLGAPFEALITAQMLRSYKPRDAHWLAALEKLKLDKSRVLHVGCSLFHDMRPAQALGFNTAFVNREVEDLSREDEPTFVVPDLVSLCSELGV